MAHSIAHLTAFAAYQAAFYTFLVARRTLAALRPEHAWRTWVSQEILVGGFLIPSDVIKLQRQGVSAVLNATSELVEPVAAINAATMDYLQVPCWDTRCPASDDADRAIEFIAAQVARGKRATDGRGADWQVPDGKRRLCAVQTICISVPFFWQLSSMSVALGRIFIAQRANVKVVGEMHFYFV